MAKTLTIKERVASLETKFQASEQRHLNNETERAHILRAIDDMKKSSEKSISKIGNEVKKLSDSIETLTEVSENNFKSLNDSIKKINKKVGLKK